MKRILFLLLMIVLCGCQSDDSYVQKSIEKLYLNSYEVLENKEYSGDELEVMEAKYDALIETFQDDFKEGMFIKYDENIRALMTINTIKEDYKIESLEVKDIEINETGQEQYQYTITLLVNGETEEISQGQIRFDDNQKIEYFNLTKIPTYVDRS